MSGTTLILSTSGHFEVMSMEADEDEHSIEMQLPYIAKVGSLVREIKAVLLSGSG